MESKSPLRIEQANANVAALLRESLPLGVGDAAGCVSPAVPGTVVRGSNHGVWVSFERKKIRYPAAWLWRGCVTRTRGVKRIALRRRTDSRAGLQTSAWNSASARYDSRWGLANLESEVPAAFCRSV